MAARVSALRLTKYGYPVYPGLVNERPTSMSETTITAKKSSHGTVVRVLPDGSDQPFPLAPMRELTDDAIEAAALSDPDAQPLTLQQLAQARPVAKVKVLRRSS